MIFDCLFEEDTSNVYIVGDDGNNVIIVDPGNNRNNHLIRHLEKLNVNVKAIFLTHGHYDHIEAVKDIKDKYKDAKIYIHYLEEEFLNNPKLNLSFRHLTNHNVIEYDYETTSVTDNEIIDIVNLKIKVIHTPFHTRGSVCYLLLDKQILFSGDTLFYRSIGRSDLPTGNSKQIPSSLLKLAKLDEKINVYPGHGRKTTIEQEIKYNQYLRFIY